MNCELARYHIQEALDGCCENYEELKSHLATCASCRKYQQQLQSLEQAFDKEIKAPAALMQRVIPRRRPWIPVAIAAAGLVIIISHTLLQPQPPTDIETALSWMGPDIEQLE